VNYIVEIARPHSLCQCTDLLGEQLLITIAECMDALIRTVLVGVMYFTPDRFEHYAFIIGEVQFYSRNGSPALQWTPIADPALNRRPSTRVFINLERDRIL
jgi:hypothetical protein